MKKIYVFVVLMATPFLSEAQQKLTRFDWLRGQRIKNYVQVKLQNNVIKWRDGMDENDQGNFFLMSTSESQPTVFRARKPKMNLKMSFLNPINFSISIKQTDQEDPLFQTSAKFSESLINVATIVSKGDFDGLAAPTDNVAPPAPIQAEEKKVSDVLEKISKQDKSSSNQIVISSLPPGIANWFLWYDSQAQLNKIDTKSPDKILIQKLEESIESHKMDRENANKVIGLLKSKKKLTKIQLTQLTKARQDSTEAANLIFVFSQHLIIAKGKQIAVCFPVASISLLATRVIEVEGYIHGSFKLDTPTDPEKTQKQLSFDNHIRAALLDLRSAYSYPSLRQAKTRTEGLIAALTLKQEVLLSQLKDIQAFGNLASADNLGGDFCKTFNFYTRAEFTSYSNGVTAIVKKRTELLMQMSELLKAVNTYLDEDTTREIVINIGRMRSIAISIVERKIMLDNLAISVTQSENPIYAYCVVNETSWAVPEVAAGLAYPTALNYSNYGLDLYDVDNSIVVDNGSKRTYLLAGAFLNMIFDAKISPGVFPMLQLGVTTGKQYPSLLGGIGLRFYPDRSISLGWVGAFDQQLTSYPVGSIVPKVDSQKFNDSIKYRLRGGGLYLAFQWKF